MIKPNVMKNNTMTKEQERFCILMSMDYKEMCSWCEAEGLFPRSFQKGYANRYKLVQTGENV